MIKLGQIYILKPEFVSYVYPLRGFIASIVYPIDFGSLDIRFPWTVLSEEELNKYFVLQSDPDIQLVIKIDNAYYKANDKQQLELI